MEDPIPFDPHPNSLPTPPLDNIHHHTAAFDADDLLNLDLDFDFDFNVNDLTFADDFFIEPQNTNSALFDASHNPNSNYLSSPEGNHGLISSEDSNFGPGSGNTSDRDVSSNLSQNSKIKEEEIVDNSTKCVVSKRKKEFDHEFIDEVRISKIKRPSSMQEDVSANLTDSSNGKGDDNDKRRARLMRNRESAQLSRQRKKQYVEELEDKVRSMHSTITDLNGKISYIMAENASLRHQLTGGGVSAPHPPPPGMAMYPMAPMPYPWMPYAPYMVKLQGGSHVPLVPIPRLKPQQGAAASKVNKKSDEKKRGKKTKKIASVSLIGLLFFMLLFGGLVPIVNVKYGGVGNGYGEVLKASVFMVDKQVGGSKFSSHGRIIQQSNSSTDGFNPNGNLSEPLIASLYVPRNDKLVKIDGNLIIHSVLASEKAKASQTVKGTRPSEETGLAIHGSYPPYPSPRPGRRPHLDRNQNGRQRALGSSSSSDFTPGGSDGKLQQWFREGLAGPMLSSGMCTEVFQFDISPTPGAIVPATSIANVTSKDRQNSTRTNKPRNRRILHEDAIPLDGNTLNTTEMPQEHSDGFQGNKSSSSMVVSVLVDPREAGDGDGEGVVRSKTMSRIFVVVLIDSVKYVTYSCMLPFMGSGNHLVTT